MKDFMDKFFNYLVKNDYWVRNNTSIVGRDTYIYNKNYTTSSKFFSQNIIASFTPWCWLVIEKDFVEQLYQEFIFFCWGKEALTDNKTNFERRLKNRSDFIYFATKE